MANKSIAMQFLEKITGGPLTFGRMLQSIRLGEEQTLDVFARCLKSRERIFPTSSTVAAA